MTFSFGTTGMGLDPIGVRPDHVITGANQRTLGAGNGERVGVDGWDRRKKRMQIRSKVPSFVLRHFGTFGSDGPAGYSRVHLIQNETFVDFANDFSCWTHLRRHPATAPIPLRHRPRRRDVSADFRSCRCGAGWATRTAWWHPTSAGRLSAPICWSWRKKRVAPPLLPIVRPAPRVEVRPVWYNRTLSDVAKFTWHSCRSQSAAHIFFYGSRAELFDDERFLAITGTFFLRVRSCRCPWDCVSSYNGWRRCIAVVSTYQWKKKIYTHLCIGRCLLNLFSQSSSPIFLLTGCQLNWFSSQVALRLPQVRSVDAAHPAVLLTVQRLIF